MPYSGLYYVSHDETVLDVIGNLQLNVSVSDNDIDNFLVHFNDLGLRYIVTILY